MKKKISIVVACLMAAIAAAMSLAPPSGRVTLAWDYPTNLLGTNLWFNIYSSTNLNEPITNWVCLRSVVGTNLQATVTVQPGAHASNFWGESLTSNVALTPDLARPAGDTLTIHRGD